jgi:hypothetical protein
VNRFYREIVKVYSRTFLESPGVGGFIYLPVQVVAEILNRLVAGFGPKTG